MIIGTRIKDPSTKGERCKDKCHMITRLSNDGRRWWLMSCFELKELVVISTQNSNFFSDSRLSGNTNPMLLLLFSCLCMNCDFNMVVMIVIIAINIMMLATIFVVLSTMTIVVDILVSFSHEIRKTLVNMEESVSTMIFNGWKICRGSWWWAFEDRLIWRRH